MSICQNCDICIVSENMGPATILASTLPCCRVTLGKLGCECMETLLYFQLILTLQFLKTKVTSYIYMYVYTHIHLYVHIYT